MNVVIPPSAAAAVLGGSRLPVTHENARANAVYAQSLALKGKLADAKRLFDLVLAREPDQAEALRGRSTIEARMGQAKLAIIDAQRLVKVPAQPLDRSGDVRGEAGLDGKVTQPGALFADQQPVDNLPL